MKVVLADEALADLEDIAGWILKDNPVRALSFSRELRDRSRSLATQAALFPLVEGLEDLGIRRRGYRGYLIFYRIEPPIVTVLRILNGSRDHFALLQGDDQ